MSISFYSQAGAPYGVMSNYEKRHPIELDGRTWRSVEHYYQHERLTGHPEIQKQIAEAQWPGRAKLIAHRNLHHVDSAWWESAREGIMLKALRAKFGQHEDLRKLLLSTGEAELVEASPSDAYWGRQPDGSGANRLGVLLMQVRRELRENPHWPERAGG